MVIAYGLSGIVEGAFTGILMVGFFYRPGSVTGPTRRIYHLLLSAFLVFAGVEFVVQAFGPDAKLGTSASQQHAVGAGLATGYVLGGGWLATVRRRRGRQLEKYREALAARRPQAPTRQHHPSWMAVAWQYGVRAVDYLFGASLCVTALIVGASVSSAASSWITQHGLHATVVVFLTVHLASLAYSQLITARAIAALNTAVRRDWHLRRARQFQLAAGPFLAALPLTAISVGLSLGLISQLAALWIGYRRTDAPPAGTLKTLQQIRASKRIGDSPMRESPPKQPDPAIG